MSEEEKKYTPMTYGLSIRVDKKMYDEWVAEMHKSPRRGWKRILCFFGIHDWGGVWEVRPETKTNMAGLGIKECWRCHRIGRW